MVSIKKQGKFIYLLVTIIILMSITACNSASFTPTTEGKKVDATSIPTSTSEIRPTVTPVPTSTVNPPTATTGASSGFSASIGKLPLPYEVQHADKVFIGQITKIGELVWDTPDGKDIANQDSSQTKYHYIPEQLAPIDVIVTNSLKGSLSKGEKLTILFPGAPGSKPYGGDSNFPKVNDTLLWFVGNEIDYREGLGSTPLMSLNIQTYYFLQPDGTFISSADNISTATLNDVQQAVGNPPQDPKSVAAALVPTPIVKAGQAVNLVNLHNLNKTQYIMIKGKTTQNGSRITDAKQVQAIVSTLNVTLVGMEDLSPPSPQDADNVLIVFYLTSGEEVSFTYNLKLGYLTSAKTDYRVLAPPNLRVVLGI